MFIKVTGICETGICECIKLHGKHYDEVPMGPPFHEGCSCILVFEVLKVDNES